MYNTSFIKKILLVATVVLLYSCDKDFNAIGDNLIGDNHFDLQGEKYDVLAYNQEITPIQSNALAVNGLGIYDNPVLGTTKGNYVTQLIMASYAPTIGDEPVADSVVLSVPYFKHVKSSNADGSTTYELDSIYGATAGKLKLSVYESGVQMRTSYFDSGSQMAQLYYTDQNTDFDNFKKEPRLNDDPSVLQNDQFFFSSAEINQLTTDATTGKKTLSRLAPEMHLKLNTGFFDDKILKAPATKLASADAFQEYFRGLYFKVERPDTGPTNMALLDFSKGKITIYYKAKTAITTDAETVKENKTLDLTLGSATASLLNDTKNSTYDTAIKNPDNVNGDANLYLKGGQGSLAVIDLSNFATKLAEIRANKWMVNEANLVFYIDSDKMKDADYEPKRVYLYDLTNNVPLIDYSDGTSGFAGTDPKATRYIFGGLLEVDATTKRGKSYKVRITNHIRNLIKDATAVNVKLGLVVTESIDIATSNKLKLKNSVISEAPRGSVMSPVGTILYGSKASVPEAQRLRLEVYYTKPN
ncbi:protein of unknown function [Flavobacterium aquidurense]|uniref:DUF4270 domain-containing protein n=1 Tax=Flavobacterium frigidimaris TaxID=262320 RepID=A0ABX4BV47_FLAFR|nr:DUF4270 domain-containing protein [Flavobacterium frigidimaris]OXA81831.1 hypothetical protein B0A65_02025 [Flavobacterium frigidimaris]SDZ35085.1 protein of unknown function [Flavobacterium aquidurense]